MLRKASEAVPEGNDRSPPKGEGRRRPSREARRKEEGREGKNGGHDVMAFEVIGS